MASEFILVALTSRRNGFQRLQAESARRAAESLGIGVEATMSEGYAIDQIHQVFRHIHAPVDQRPVAIVMEPVSGDGIARLARNAVRAGIAWVGLNHRAEWHDELRREHPRTPVASVETDQRAVGRLQGQQLKALLPRGGNVLGIQGPSEHPAARARQEGLDQECDGAGFEFVPVEGQWTLESGDRLMRNWLRLRAGRDLGLAAVACQNDEMAAGARAALLADGEGLPAWREVPFLGVDGLPEGGRRLVDRGELAATIVNRPNSGPAVEMIGHWLQTGRLRTERLVLDPFAYPEAGHLVLAAEPGVSRPARGLTTPEPRSRFGRPGPTLMAG